MIRYIAILGLLAGCGASLANAPDSKPSCEVICSPRACYKAFDSMGGVAVDCDTPTADKCICERD